MSNTEKGSSKHDAPRHEVEAAHDAHDAHDAAHAHDFDPEPADRLPSDEPPTPGYVPIVGGVIFLCVALAGLVAQSSGEGAAPKPSPTPAAPPAAVTARPAAPPQAPVQLLGSARRPNPLKDVSPETLKALRERKLAPPGMVKPGATGAAPAPQAP